MRTPPAISISKVAFPFRVMMLGSTLLMLHARVDAQGTVDYVTGKVYVIRISPECADRAQLEAVFAPQVLGMLDEAYGLMEQAKPFLHSMLSLSDRKWFLVYFNPDRQSESALLQDHYLFNWALHGHYVQLYPLEQMASPAQLVDLATPSLERR